MASLRKTRAGFTLVEMLVVIAIVAILAGIILPVLANSRNKARQVDCLNNLKNLGQAFSMYIHDNYGYFPPWCASHPNPMSPPDPKNAPANYIMTWDKALVMDFLQGKEETVICPSNPMPKSVMGPGADVGLCRSYAIARYTQRPQGANFWGGYAQMIPNPPKTVLLFEKGANLPGSWGDALGENVHQSHDSKGQSGYREDMFHFKGKNILFVDGNVKLYHEGEGPFAWDSKRTASGNQNTGPGVCEVWGEAKPDGSGGDWPPRD